MTFRFPLHALLILLAASILHAQPVEWLSVTPIAYDGKDGANAVAVAPDGSVYVAGRLNLMMEEHGMARTKGNQGEFFVGKYDPMGRVLWIARRTGLIAEDRHFGDKVESQGDAIAVDGAGNVFAAGVDGESYDHGRRSKSLYNSRPFLAMYDSGGTVRWSVPLELIFGAGRVGSMMLPPALAGDPEGGVFIAFSVDRAGYADTTFADARRFTTYLAHITMEKEIDWMGRIDASGFSRVDGIGVDPDGRVIVAGLLRGSGTLLGEKFDVGDDTTRRALFLAKLDRDGDIRWLHPSVVSDDISELWMGIDREGEIGIGTFRRPDFSRTKRDRDSIRPDTFILRCDDDGKLLWSRAVTLRPVDESRRFHRVYSFGVDRDGMSYIGGFFQSTYRFGDSASPGGVVERHSAGEHAFICCYDRAGAFQGVLTAIGDAASHYETMPYAIAGGDFDGVYVAGDIRMRGTTMFGRIPLALDGTDAFLARIGRPAEATSWGNVIEGTVFLDMDRDGARDVGEPAIPGAAVFIDQGARSVQTDSMGRYRFVVGSGRYTISTPFVRGMKKKTLATSFDADKGTSRTTDIPLQPTGTARDLAVGALWIDEVMSDGTYPLVITYRNDGVRIETGTVTLAMRTSNYTIASSDPAPSFERNGSPVWSFRDLLPGESRRITLHLRSGNPNHVFNPRIGYEPMVATIDPRDEDATANNVFTVPDRYDQDGISQPAVAAPEN